MINKLIILIIAIILGLMVVFTSLNYFEKPETMIEENKLSIMATIYPYQLLISQLAGDKATVSTIVPLSVSPHTYSPTPSDIKRIEDADLVFSNGAELEIYLEKILDNLGEKHISATDFLSHLISETPIEKNPHDHSHNHDHHHHNINPHFWLDPLLLIPISEGIVDKLAMFDPDNSDYYFTNLYAFKNDLLELDKQIRNERLAFNEINVLNFHSAFHYFNKRYGINSVGVIVSSPGNEPTAKELTAINQKVKKSNVATIFTEPQLNPKSAEIIAKELNLSLEVLDPLGGTLEANSIAEVIKINWNRIKSGI